MPKKELENEAIERNQPKAQAMQGFALENILPAFGLLRPPSLLESEQCVNLPHLCKFPTCLPLNSILPMVMYISCGYSKYDFQSFLAPNWYHFKTMSL